MTGPAYRRARNRYFVIALSRVAGVALAVVGLIALGGRWPAVPEWMGFAGVAIGMAVIALVPRTLARRWRTPPTE